jgi:FKBP-type peptidyl-prolyl cis-trans isomerase FkpA
MSRFLPRTAPILAVAIALSLAACQKAGDADTAKADAAASGETAGGLDIPGLKGEKAQASYMVGMDLAESLEPIKEKIDLDVVVEAMRTGLTGGEAKLDDEQRKQIRERFSQALQAERQAEREAQAQANKQAGEAFLAANAKKEGVQVTDSGLQYQVLEAGNGPKPGADAIVRVHYKGQLLDGTTFDSSYDRGEPATIPLAQVVPGWQEGIALMPVGSKYKLWIPSKLAYGETGTPGGPIGPNATLAFEVELLEIVEPETR